MGGPVLSVTGAAAITAVASAVKLIVIVLRQWALRFRTNTASTIIADVGIWSAFCCHWVITGLFSVDYDREEKIRRKVQGELEVTLLVVTRPFLLRDFSAYLLYITELWCVKLAYLGFYFPLRSHLSPRNRNLYTAVCVWTAIGYVATMGATMFRCWPLSRNGDFYSPDQCIALLKISTYGVITPFHISILFLGLRIIYGLHPSRLKRRALLHVAALGFISSVMGAVRSGTIIEAVHHQEDRFLQRIHFVNAIATIELMLAYMALCIPSFRGLSCRITIAGKSIGTNSSSSEQRSREIPPQGTIGGSGKANRRKVGMDTLELTAQDTVVTRTSLGGSSDTVKEDQRNTVEREGQEASVTKTISYPDSLPDSPLHGSSGGMAGYRPRETSYV